MADIRTYAMACHSLQEIFALWRKPATVCRRYSHYGESLPQFAGDVRSMAKPCHRIGLAFAGMRNFAIVLWEKFPTAAESFRVVIQN